MRKDWDRAIGFCMTDYLELQTVEEGIKPGHKAAKDALKQTKDRIPEPEEARKQARDYTENAAQATAKTVKDNARPTADQIEKEAIRPAQKAAEALPDQVKVRINTCRPQCSTQQLVNAALGSAFCSKLAEHKHCRKQNYVCITDVQAGLQQFVEIKK